jgi:hypothetical protein
MPLAPSRLITRPSSYAVYLDGLDDYVEVKHSSVLEPTNITAILWINPFSWLHTPTAVALIVKRTDTPNGYIIFWLSTTGTINFDWGGIAYRWNTGFSPPLNTWTFLAFTRSSSGRRLYVNGFLYSSTTSTGGSPASGSVLRIGMDTVTPRYWFRGYIAQVLIYTRDLSDSEIQWNCFHPDNPVISGLVLWLEADPNYVRDIDNDGIPEWIDLSGYNNHGKIYGATLVKLVDLYKSPARTLPAARTMPVAR